MQFQDLFIRNSQIHLIEKQKYFLYLMNSIDGLIKCIESSGICCDEEISKKKKRKESKEKKKINI